MSDIICAKCRYRVPYNQADGLDRCPKCGSKGVPMSADHQVNININIHELRILGIWAENYAAMEDNKHLDNAYHESLVELVNIITELIRKQLPNHEPLTLTQEVQEVREVLKCDAILYRNGKEEI